MSNKLFCTFTAEEELQHTLDRISSRYTIIYNKIFILKDLNSNEFFCTYNVDLNNVDDFLDNTILVHRKKETNTLYTINALNMLILELNNGFLDKRFKISWNFYKNTILLSRNNTLQKVKTGLYKIFEI